MYRTDMAVIADSLDYCPTLPDPAASMRYEVGTENSEITRIDE